MITTCLQAFPHRRQARLFPSGRFLVQCTPRQPLLPCACEKFFCVLKVNGIGVIAIVDGDPPLQLTMKAKSKMSMAIPPLQNVGEGVFDDVEVDGGAPHQ